MTRKSVRVQHRCSIAALTTHHTSATTQPCSNMFSICNWLIQTWNPQIQRADCTCFVNYNTWALFRILFLYYNIASRNPEILLLVIEYHGISTANKMDINAFRSSLWPLATIYFHLSLTCHLVTNQNFRIRNP